MKDIEIACDASTRSFPNGKTLYSAGAICINNYKAVYKTGIGTNNQGELMAFYLAVKLADEIRKTDPYIRSITIYSDSKLTVFGFKIWMRSWIKNMDCNGVLYSSSGEPVKNQELFKMIANYIVDNKIKVRILHTKGHVNINSQQSLAMANRVFKESNGFFLSVDKLKTICFYNSVIDKATRTRLENDSPENYVDNQELDRLVSNIMPNNYWHYIS